MKNPPHPATASFRLPPARADGAWSAELSASRSAIERQLEGLRSLPAPAEQWLPIRSALDLGRQVLHSIQG
jgi:hypothetical protein